MRSETAGAKEELLRRLAGIAERLKGAGYQPNPSLAEVMAGAECDPSEHLRLAEYLKELRSRCALARKF